MIFKNFRVTGEILRSKVIEIKLKNDFSLKIRAIIVKW